MMVDLLIHAVSLIQQLCRSSHGLFGSTEPFQFSFPSCVMIYARNFKTFAVLSSIGNLTGHSSHTTRELLSLTIINACA